MSNRKDNGKGGYSKHLKKGGGKKAVLYDTLDEGQLFGQITKIDGEGRFRVLCNDGMTRRGKACNQIRKTKDMKICLESFVIISLRDCDTKDDKCDILGFADPPHNILLYFKNMNNTINGVNNYSKDNNNDLIFNNDNKNVANEDNEDDDELNIDDI